MAANSKSPYDVLLWIQNMLDSCKTYEQTVCVKNLIIQFDKTYKLEYNSPIMIMWHKLLRNSVDKSLNFLKIK